MFVLYPGLWVKKCEGLSRQSHIFYAWTNTKKESFLFLLLPIDGMWSFIIDSREKISLDKKSLQIQAKSCDFILNPGLKLFSLCVGLVPLLLLPDQYMKQTGVTRVLNFFASWLKQWGMHMGSARFAS